MAQRFSLKGKTMDDLDLRMCPCGIHAGTAWFIDPSLRGCPRCKKVWPERLVDGYLDALEARVQALENAAVSCQHLWPTPSHEDAGDRCVQCGLTRSQAHTQ